MHEIDEEKFFTIKAYALLHDPPNKMWALLAGVDHERVAREMFKEIFSDTPFGGGVPPTSGPLMAVVKNADRFASSVDRFSFYSPWGARYVVKYYRLHNIFDPKRSRELPQSIPQEAVERYLNTLRNEIHRACKGDVRKCYHAFYALYEALWIARGLPPSLADTRAPTHDVFDHLYATAMMTNWLMYGDEPAGYFVTIDIPGVQEFVPAGRKAGDFWAGSWIISMTGWLTLWPLVWELGPDILLRPTARLNPFYYVFLKKQLGLEEIFESLFNKFGVPLELKAGLVQPFIGERAQLVLPPFKFENGRAKNWSHDEVRDYVLGRFKEALKCMTALARGEQCNLLEDVLNIKGGDDISREEGGIFENLLRRLGELADVRLPLRISILDVREEYHALKCPEELERELGEDCKSLLFFDWLLRMRGREGTPAGRSVVNSRRYVPTPGPWFKPGSLDELNPVDPLAVDNGLNVFKKSQNWRYCSACGREPAVFGLRKVFDPATGREDYNAEDLKELIDKLGKAGSPGTASLHHLHRVVRPGEFLGPTCLAKRLIYHRVSGGLVKFESTEDVAIRRLVDKVDIFKGRTGCENIVSYLNQTVHDLESIWPGPHSVETMRREWRRCLEGLGEDVKVLLNKSEFKKFVKYADDERSMLKVAQALGGPRLFYAIVRGDGDNVGRLLDGYLPYNWYEEVKRMIDERIINKMTAEGDVQQLEADKKRALKVLDALEKYAYALAEELGETQRHPPLIITPTFRVAISRAMAITALKDWAIVEKHGGLLIYAGGDDVVALTPVEDSLEVAAECRRNYWGEDGFHKAGDYVIPALTAYGRSFVVRYVHVMDIMSEEFVKSYKELEHFSKEAKWSTHEKDSITISSSRTPARAVLPFRDVTVAQSLEELWAMMLAGKLSSNTPYDIDAVMKDGGDALSQPDVYLKLVTWAVKRNVAVKGLEKVVMEILMNGDLCGVEYTEGVKEAVKIYRRLP